MTTIDAHFKTIQKKRFERYRTGRTFDIDTEMEEGEETDKKDADEIKLTLTR